MPGKTLPVRDRTHASTQPNDDDHRQRDDEAVREPEEQPDREDRRPAPEPLEQRVTEAAERQLLDERHPRADDDAVHDVRGGVRAAPSATASAPARCRDA